MKLFVAVLLFLFPVLQVGAQFVPPAGQEGSTAIYVDSAVFVDWANNCNLQRGWMNIADTSLGKTSYGNVSSAVGKADNNVVSLGDGGSATLFFNKPIANGNGYDFAVFENAFTDDFLELAFVEVSSDSLNFYRFPAVSNTQTGSQIETFGTLDATKIHNMAGKYRLYYGVPFDLEELKDEPGLNVNSIVAVRIIDVVGSLDSSFCRYESEGNKINDPWPTPFETGGFDLDGVGVIHNKTTAVTEHGVSVITVYPNPCNSLVFVSQGVLRYSVFDIAGKLLKSSGNVNNNCINLMDFPKGLLLLDLESEYNKHHVVKLIKN